MLGVSDNTAEEFYGRLLASVKILDDAAHRHVENGAVVPAIAAALGSDVSAVQVALWERLVIASRAPQRMYFQSASSLVVSAQVEGADDLPMEGTAEQTLISFRARMLSEVAPALKSDIRARWTNLAYLAGVAAPTNQQFLAHVEEVLEGHTPPHFIAAKQQAAHEDMLVAQTYRMRNDVQRAIESAFASDFHLLQSYLVESALAAGDQRLLSVSIRRDLVDAAIADLAGLPSDFGSGVDLLRRAMCSALSLADAERLQSRFHRL